MSKMIKNLFAIDEQSMQAITARMNSLENEGVMVNETASGEMNFAGCARGYCQAWD